MTRPPRITALEWSVYWRNDREKEAQLWAAWCHYGRCLTKPPGGWHRLLTMAWKSSRKEWRRAYRFYLFSRTWQRRRKKALNRAGRVCEVCGSDKRLEVHHTFYGNAGREKPEDLKVLCRACHKAYHDGADQPAHTLPHIRHARKMAARRWRRAAVKQETEREKMKPRRRIMAAEK